MLYSILLSHLLDVVYPFHTGILLSLHPVHTSYVMSLRLAPPFSSRMRGVLVWFVVVVVHIALYSLILYAAWSISRFLWLLASSWILKTSFSLRLLLETVSGVGARLDGGDVWGARRLVSGIVRRDVRELGPGHVASAALESLAESMVDGYVSPLFYALALGPLGALLQRLANTLDGSLGYKTPEYRDVGWFSARMDTVLNYVPARLTALLLILLSPIALGDPRRAWMVWRRDASATDSVNAGHPMSAMAGALGVRLEKKGYYKLGEGPLPGPLHVRLGLRLAVAAALAWLSICIIVLSLL